MGWQGSKGIKLKGIAMFDLTTIDMFVLLILVIGMCTLLYGMFD